MRALVFFEAGRGKGSLRIVAVDVARVPGDVLNQRAHGGLNGVGTKAVNALSKDFLVKSHREGQFVEVSQYESTAALMGAAILDYTANGTLPQRQGNRDIVPLGIVFALRRQQGCDVQRVAGDAARDPGMLFGGKRHHAGADRIRTTQAIAEQRD